MWSSRLFWKVFLAYAVLLILTVGACSAIIAGWQEEQLVKQVRRRLHDSATLFRESVSNGMPLERGEQLQRQVRRLGQQANTRFTVVDASGQVLADSERETLASVATMDNHLNRQEFLQAKHHGSGYSQRQSPTLQLPFLYFALVLDQAEKPKGYIRAAQPLATIQSEVASVRKLIAIAGLSVGLIGLLVTYWLTRRIVLPIQKLTQAAEAKARNAFPHPIDTTTKDEIGALARAFQHMVERLGRREKALRESVDRQATVLSGMNEGVLAIDNEQHVLFANRAAGDILGFAPEKAEDCSLLELARCNDLRELAQRAVTTGQLAQREIQWQSDSLRKLEVTATPLPSDPCPGVVLVLHDVTELKRLEGLRQEFVANVSHELKTPLSSIKAYTETLLNGALEDREHARRFLQRIDDQSDRLHELIIDLLVLARLESGAAELDLTVVPVARVVDACLSGYEARAQAKQVGLHTEMPEIPLLVTAEEESLLQILNNLVDNALKYTPAGGTIHVRWREETPQAIIEVSDTGPGIDPVHHARLFERFYRVDKARSRELGGTGLGLAIVKHLCHSLDGAISIESTPGRGSTFRVEIPLAPTPRGV